MLLACIDISDEFFDALKHYVHFFRLDIQLQKFDPAITYGEDERMILLAHNHKPEDFRISSKILKIRSFSQFCTRPIIFVSEPLSPTVGQLFSDKEFIWICELPFDSAQFLALVSRVTAFMELHSESMGLRAMIHSSIERKAYGEAGQLAAQVDPSYPYPFHIRMTKGLVALESGNLKSAEEHFKNACHLIPDSFEALIELTNKAAEVYVKNLIHWGNIFMDRGESERSLTAFEKAIGADPNNMEAKNGLIAANLLCGNTEMVRKIVDESPQSFELARLCNLKGVSMAKAGNFAAAETLYKNEMKFLPDDTAIYKLWFNLGLCMKSLKDYRKALFYFEKAQQFAPSDFVKVTTQIKDMKRAVEMEKIQKGSFSTNS